VLVVDDHALFRRGLEIVLAQEPDIEVVGEAGDGAEAVVQAADLLPDVVLMDVRMPRRSGIEACTAIKDVVNNQFTSGTLQFNIANAGAGYQLDNITVGSDVQAELDKVMGEIKAGTLTPPSTKTWS